MFAIRYTKNILAVFVWTALYAATTHNVLAQSSNGTCVCQPGVIEFTFNFALGCDNNTIINGLPGIEETICVVTPVGILDNVPVSVISITVNEVDALINPLQTENFTDTYLSGDTFTYSTYAFNEPDMVMNGTIPNALQVSITGFNVNNEEIINNFVVVFTNDCNIYPVLEEGNSIGWVSLTTVTGPPPEFCPAFVPESNVPSSVPSLTPTSGDDKLCNCQPGTLTLTLDYDLTCEEGTILTGDPGIEEAQCMVFSTNDLMVSDPVPVAVTSVLIFELDKNLDTLSATRITETFESGDIIVYDTFAVNNTDAVSSGSVPRGLQISVIGVNAAGDDLTNAFVILFTNECDIYPVLTTGDTIGWTRISMNTGPPAGLCPAFDVESTVPSLVPSRVPITMESTVPSIVPSRVPITIESTLPSNVPSSTPVAFESTLPSLVPTTAPVATESVLPSLVPSSLPTNAPVPLAIETLAPSLSNLTTTAPVSDAPVAPISPVAPTAVAPVDIPIFIPAPTCPPIGKKGKDGNGKGGKGKGDSERLLRTGGGEIECPEPKEQKMKKEKIKDNMSMDIKKKKGMKMSKGDEGKMPKQSKDNNASKGDTGKGMGKGGDGKGKMDGGKGKMGKDKEKANEAKGDKASMKKTMDRPAKKEKLADGQNKKGKMDDPKRRQLR